MGKVGIFAPHAYGDTILVTSLLKYREELWPDKDIVWFASPSSYDALKYSPGISEIRPHQDYHYGPDVRIGLSSGQLSPNRTKFKDTADLDLGYYLTPWANRHLWDKPFHNVPPPDLLFAHLSRFILKSAGIAAEMPDWYPCIGFSKEEDERAEAFIGSLPHKKTVMLETKFTSCQSSWDDPCTEKVVEILWNVLGPCNLVFASPGSHLGWGCQKADGCSGLKAGKCIWSVLGQHPGSVVDCSGFTIRQCVPVYNRCHLFIGVSSGISTATSAWSANVEVPRIQYCRDLRSSGEPFARGKYRLCLCSDRMGLFDAVREFAIGIK